MTRYIFSTVSTCLLLMTGCTNPQPGKPGAPSPSPVQQTVREKAGTQAVSPLEQCNRDLESLRMVNATEYRRYLSEYDGLMKTSADFLTVKDDVSPEVAELARPRFQFALVNLCYRIKDTLARTFIRQAGGRE